MAETDGYQEIPISDLKVDEQNCRQQIGDIADLEDSIEHQGVLSPLIVRPGEGGSYLVVSGSRRLAASEAVGLDTVPCIVRDLSDEDAFLISASENIQRENLTPEEEAEVVTQLVEIHGSNQSAARALDKSEAWVRKRVRGKEVMDRARKVAGTQSSSPTSDTDSQGGGEVEQVLSPSHSKTDEIERAGRAAWEDDEEKQQAFYDVMKGKGKSEVRRVTKRVKAKAQEDPSVTQRDPGEVVNEVLKSPQETVRITFGSRVTQGLYKAEEDRGVTPTDIVKMAVERWLDDEGYL